MNLPLPDWNRLNDCYIRESGMESKPFLSKEFAWGNWSRHGFTEEELVMVLRYLKRQIARNDSDKRKAACMSFRNLIEQETNFEHELSLAKQEQLSRKHVPDARERILRQTGHVEPEKKTARPVGDVAKAALAFDAFKAWKEANL